MSSRIIRGHQRVKRPRITDLEDSVGGGGRLMEVEKQAFERGYTQGELMGKQMGEQMVATVVKRYEISIAEFAGAHQKLVESMEIEAVRLSLEVARSILRREVSIEPDIVTALVSVALHRLEGHQEVILRVSREDFERVSAAVENINSSVKIEEAAELDRGDFTLDTSKTHLDGRMMTRIAQVGRALLGPR